jgi:outer membrane beta-barrel protein
MEFGVDEANQPSDDEGDGQGEDQQGQQGQQGGEQSGQGTGAGAPEGDVGAGGGDDLISDLAGPDEMAEQDKAADAPRPKEATEEEIYAVQQIFALRINRLELAPSLAFTVNDPFVSHTAIGVALNYWWTNVLAVGANFLWYQGLQNNSDLNFFVRRSTRLAVPITEWQMGAHLNFTFVPLYGKFSMFNEFIFQWDAYVVGGVGLMRTRPIPVIDEAVREFDFGNRVAFNAGIGIRIFVSRFLSIFTEIRDYIYLEKLENREVALGDARTDPDTWLSGNELTNNVSVQVGFTVFFPFTFEYKLPK